MPNSDFSPFTPTVISDPVDAPTTLYTHKRVNQFVTDFDHYKESVLKDENPHLYSYYHFVASPQAIVATNLGSLPTAMTLTDDKKSCLLQPYLGLNTPLAHQMNILKEYVVFLNAIVDDSVPFTTQDRQISLPSIKGLSSPIDFDQFVDLFSKQQTAPTGDSYGVEVFVYLKCPTMETYTITFTPTDASSAFFIWIGDVALLEYCALNASLNTTQTKVSVPVTSPRKLPVRVQYFSTTRQTGQTVLDMFAITSEAGDIIKQHWFVKDTFLYPPLYAAFTSQTQNSYMAGQFQCHSNLSSIRGADKNLTKFYNVILANKRKMFKGVHDRDMDNIQEVGKLPSMQATDSTPTYISQNNPANALNLPNVFSIYRLSVDSRFGATYQIATKKTATGQHLMTPLSDKLTEYGKSYTEFSGYFPSDVSHVDHLTRDKCQQKCNESPACGHFFSYTTTGGKAQCVLGTNTPPVYNQTRVSSTTDESSGTLFLRNRQLKDKTSCAGGQIIVNTDDYTTFFPYAKYDISGGIITETLKLGMCGDDEYRRYVDLARDILYTPHTYRKDGTVEAMTTTAVQDTATVIASNLENHDLLRQRLLRVNNNDQQLQQTIADYGALAKGMEADDRYDQKGNMLMFTKSPVPSLTKLNTNDSQLLSNQQTILFYTGIVTAATLLVLAVTMGG
jgi:hypothetical protein